MGWTDYHLNEFIIKGQRYTIPNMIGNPSSCGQYRSDIKLEEFRFRKNEKFLYSYDFTAGWEFEVGLEMILLPNKARFILFVLLVVVLLLMKNVVEHIDSINLRIIG